MLRKRRLTLRRLAAGEFGPETKGVRRREAFFALHQRPPTPSTGAVALVSRRPVHYRTPDARSRRPSGRLSFCVFEEKAMKADIHPNYHMIKVVMTDGSEFVTRSTYGEPGGTLHLDIDPKTHPAWTGGSQQLLDRGGRLSRFNSRFGNLTMSKGKK
jgi:large subunit ribosomal protein L31